MSISEEFVNIALAVGALKFGEFTLKSGRISPYFFDIGRFNDAGKLATLGQLYARALMESDLPDQAVIYGPPYKGIPLTAATGCALAMRGLNPGLAYGRKEVKDHGEGGKTFGADMAGRPVIIIDDVLTAGTAVTESIGLIRQQGGKPVGLLIALDRQEIATDTESESAVQSVSRRFNLRVRALAGLSDIIATATKDPALVPHLPALKEYRGKFGAPQA